MNRESLHIQVPTSRMSAFANHPLAIAIHIRELTMLPPSLGIRIQTPVNHLLALVNRIQVLTVNGVAPAERNLSIALVRNQRTENAEQGLTRTISISVWGSEPVTPRVERSLLW